MAHHVVQDAATLQFPLPEPGHVRSAVLLSCAGQVGPPGEPGASRPEQVAAVLHLGRKQLILEISGPEPRLLCQFGDLECLGHIARQRLLAGKPGEFAPAPRNGVHDLFHVFDAGLIGPAEPDRIDGRVGHHLGDGPIRLGPADIELPGIARGGRRMVLIGTPHTQDVAIAHAGPGTDVKLGIEAAADEADAEGRGHGEWVKWFMVVGRRSSVTGRGSRVAGRGSRVTGRGSRVVGCGSRVAGRGSGSRVAGRETCHPEVAQRPKDLLARSENGARRFLATLGMTHLSHDPRPTTRDPYPYSTPSLSSCGLGQPSHPCI